MVPSTGFPKKYNLKIPELSGYYGKNYLKIMAFKHEENGGHFLERAYMNSN